MARNQKKLDISFIRMFDCYRLLLTERQRSVMELYYNEDYSLSEIAEMLGVTRQAVNDTLRHSEMLLTEIEEKTGLSSRMDRLRECVTAIRDSAAAEDPDNAKMLRLAEEALELLQN